MKKLSFLMLAVAGMLFAACSSDKDVAEGPDQLPTGVPEGYMALNIKLPTTSQMRAAGDEVFDDGLATEYKVSDCALLLFQGADEASATLINAQAILLPFDETAKDADKDNITTSYKATAKVEGYTKTSGNNLYALAMLNYKNVMSINAGVPTIAGTALTIGTSTIADVYGKTTNADLIARGGSNNYFFMTNAVLSTDKGGNVTTAPAGNIFQLATMDPTKIYDNETDAKNNPAGDIIVERAVAKATLSVSATKAAGLDIASTTWAIDNMEPATYVARNMGTTPSYIAYASEGYTPTYYRFVGNATTKDATSLGSAEDSYRTYWCVDPQYDADVTGMKAATSFVATGTANPLYCYENTFDVAHQNYLNTTRAIIKVQLVNTADFYAINGTVYALADAQTYVIDNIVNNTDIINKFNAGLNAGKSWTVNASSFNITYERNATTGQYEVKNLALSTAVTDEIGDTKTFKATFATDIATTLTAAIATANEEVQILSYKGGVMYYEARFKHSIWDGVEVAPWNTWETTNKPAGGSTTAAYPANTKTAEENYLGRYGMVRNNWYDVNVTAFNKLGDPVDPSGNVKKPTTPDDNLEEYISAKIHVLSWAKRTQSWSF